MEHSIEITKAVFNKLVALDHKPSKVDDLELARKFYYNSPLGVQLLQIDNHISAVSQYYIQDINA